jgi:hypothetical protein
MNVSVTNNHGGGTISGRADWALGYMDDKGKLEQVLVVVEAKSGLGDAAIAQLLSYLASVQDARSRASKCSTAVFGLATDFKSFQFVVLRENRKAFTSDPMRWISRKEDIVAFLDHILLDAIESSLHTTPSKVGNTKIQRFDAGLDKTYNFPPAHTDQEDDDDDDEPRWNVVVVDGVSILMPLQE